MTAGGGSAYLSGAALRMLLEHTDLGDIVQRVEALTAVDTVEALRETALMKRLVELKTIQDGLTSTPHPDHSRAVRANRSDIADEISSIQVGSGYESMTIGIDAALHAADAFLARFEVTLRPESGTEKLG